MKGILNRFRIVYLIFVLAGIIGIMKIIKIQHFEDKIVTDKDFYREVTIKAKRGSILSDDGHLLSTSTPFYWIRMDCTVAHDTIFNKGVNGLAKGIASIFKNKSSDAYVKQLRDARKNGNKYLRIGNRRVNFIELKKIEELPILKLGQFRGGIIIQEYNIRSRPYKNLANRTVGFINENGTGAGIELSYDHILKGKDGIQTKIRKIGGDWIPVPGEKNIPAVDGEDIKTTLDIEIQESAEIALTKQLSKSEILEGGSVIVMEVETGAIKAIVNLKKDLKGNYQELYNYGIGRATEPGSTLKLATLICLLEDGHVSLKDSIDCEAGEWRYAGTRFSDVKRGGYGKLSVQQAFEKSSNIAFAKLGIDAYAENESYYVSRLHNLKINERFNLEIDGEGRALVYEPKDQMWSKVSLPMMSIGYGLLLTPLHTLNLYNTVANDGKMMKPYFVDSFSKNGVITQQFQPTVLSGSICSKKTLRDVKKALLGVVEHGTAKSYKSDQYQFSGKTGTAQIATDGRYIDSKGYRKHQASFAGFFPSDKPKYSCIVVVYSEKTRGNFYGGTWAAPVFREIADRIFASHPDWSKIAKVNPNTTIDNPSIASGSTKDLQLLAQYLPMKDKPTISESAWDDVSTGVTPNVCSMGLKDAIYLLENEGYTVNFQGKGRVIKQTPSAGSAIKKGDLVNILLAEQR